MVDWRDDPRWRTVVGFLRSAPEADQLRAEQLVCRIQECLAALRSIVADPSLPAEQRDTARAVLDDFAERERVVTPETLKALALVADAPGADPETRSSAQATLEWALLRLRDVIDDPSMPDEIREQAKRARRNLLSS